MASILDEFAEAVARHPHKTAIVDGTGQSITFKQLQVRADRIAKGWHASGVRSGDRVLLAMGVGIDLYASLAALWSLGATVVLPEPAMGIAGLRHAARVTNVSAFCSAGLYGILKYAFPELWPLRHLRPREVDGPDLALEFPPEDAIALVSFTSGTTGAPKAIPRSHGFLTAQHRAIAPLLHSEIPERDLVAFPVFVLINIAGGQTSVLPSWKSSRLDRLHAATLEHWVTSQKVTRVLLPPLLCDKLAATKVPASLHTVFTGGGPVFPDILDALSAAKADLRIVSVYGSTEAEPIAHLDAKDVDAQDQAQMISGQGLLVGRPVDAIQVRIEQGEIQVSGAHVNEGYLDPKHDAENKVHDGSVIWHRTGDSGYFDDQDRLWLLGRLGSEVQTLNGLVFPFSVEVAVRKLTGVRQCALVSLKGAGCLVIEGDRRHEGLWSAQAVRLGIAKLEVVTKIPMDKRHRSKVDRAALDKLLMS